jgi:chromosome segregation ATPase
MGQGADTGGTSVARGITESDVHAAADALVAQGERPTVERIRAHLGTGSPNTVVRLLDTWWGALGNRLTAQQHKVALPEAPAEVAALAGQLWEQALRVAHTQAGLALQQERQSLAEDRLTLERERASVLEEAQHQRAALVDAREARSLAEARLAEAQRLIDQQADQLADLTRQRDAAHDRGDRLEQEVIAVGTRLEQQKVSAAAEREAQIAHLRATEDRSHAEVDRARQETKEARAQLAAYVREQRAAEQAGRRERDEASAHTVAAQREAAAQRARADALEQQLARLSDHAKSERAVGIRKRAGATPKPSRKVSQKS